MQIVYLTRRNLEVLLSKLDRRKAGDICGNFLNKHDTRHPLYPQTDDCIQVVALENEEYYIDRPPGYMDSADLVHYVPEIKEVKIIPPISERKLNDNF